MNNYVLSCCSTADLSEEHFRSRNVSYVCFHYKLDDVEYSDDLGKSMPRLQRTTRMNLKNSPSPSRKKEKIFFMLPSLPVFQAY